MTAPNMLHPVYGFSLPFRRETLAVFFTGSDATDFVLHPEHHGFEKRECYLAPPQYDERVAGYRFEPLVEVEVLEPRNGRHRRAA